MEEKEKVSIDDLATMIKNGFDGVDKKFEKIEEDIEDLKTDVGILKNTMVTKTYLDDKIADLKGDFVVEIKNEDRKVEKITEKLGAKKIFNSKDVEEIKSIKVFAKTI